VEDQQRALELRDYIGIIRRRKWYIIVPATVIVVATLVASVLTTPIYQASTDIMIALSSQSAAVADVAVPAVDPQRELQTQMQVILSKPVAEEVVRRLGLNTGPEAIQSRIGAQILGQTNIIRVTARHPSPAMARDLANNVAGTYIDLRRKAALDNYAKQAADIQQKLDEATVELKKAEDELAAAIAGARGERVDIGQQAAVQSIASRRDQIATVQNFWKTALDKLQIQSGLQTSSAEIVSPAVLPTSPVEPRLGRQMAFALAISLILGTALAFVVDYLDDSIRSKEEAAKAFSAPILGMVPRAQNWTDRSEAMLASLRDPASTIAETYRSIRTNLQFSLLDSDRRVLIVSSASKGEGKSSTVSNLAVVLAQSGKSVIVVDADLRRPRIHRFFHLSNAQGLTTAILAERPLADLLQRPRLAGSPPNLLVLTSGPVPPNPADLLGSQRMSDIIESLAKLADFVLVDTPPIIALSDAAVLAPKADGVILVARATKSSRRTARYTKERVDAAGGKLIGVVLNEVTPAFGEAGYYYYYDYYYYITQPYRQSTKAKTGVSSLISRGLRRSTGARAAEGAGRH
jgi:succinoglycan biosynthesis transport protein ExoP